MPPLMVSETFALLLAACAPCFTAPTYQTFWYLVAGWLQCPERHTVTGVAIAAEVAGGDGARGWRHRSVLHRFFSRARWDPDALGKVVFRLALRRLPADCPLLLLVDDRLARKHGKAIALGSMHHDPLLSRGRKAFSSALPCPPRRPQQATRRRHPTRCLQAQWRNSGLGVRGDRGHANL
ncbi:MAG: transposase [Chloroflexi bacterium]|nr:transposase [Chloroflexota bacterium]